jgi:hypothetical protein
MAEAPLSKPASLFTPENILVAVTGIATIISGLVQMTFPWRFPLALSFIAAIINLCLKSAHMQNYVRSPISRVWLSLFASGLIIAALWNPLRGQYAKEHAAPSLVYVTGAPLGSPNAPVWQFAFKHFGPDSAFNCHGNVIDVQQDGSESEFHHYHPNPSTVYEFRFSEVDLVPGFGDHNYQWVPRNPNYQHYKVDIICRDGQFLEDFVIARVNGLYRVKFDLTRSEYWIKEHPELEREVFHCGDSFNVSSPRLLPSFAIEPTAFFYPYWHPNGFYIQGMDLAPPPPNAVVPPEVVALDKMLMTFRDTGVSSPCWALFNGPSKHLGEIELPLSLTGFQIGIAAYGMIVIGLPLYIFALLRIMGVSLVI